jgi:hypothetical protein
LERLSNVDAGQTITVEEGKGIVKSRKYQNQPPMGTPARVSTYR